MHVGRRHRQDTMGPGGTVCCAGAFLATLYPGTPEVHCHMLWAVSPRVALASGHLDQAGPRSGLSNISLDHHESGVSHTVSGLPVLVAWRYLALCLILCHKHESSSVLTIICGLPRNIT